MASYAVSTQTNIANGTVMTLAIIAVALRIVARVQRNVPFKADDYWIFGATMVSTAACALAMYVGSRNLYATSWWEMSQQELDKLPTILPIDIILTYTCYALVKLSILSFCTRVFVQPRFTRIAYTVMAFVSLNSILGIIIQSIFWKPADASWRYFRLGATKLPFHHSAFLLSEAVLNTFFDIVVFALPLPVVQSLQISRRKKWSLFTVFGLGVFCGIASIIRVYYSVQWLRYSEQKLARERYGEIISWTVTWVHIEISCAIVGACLPTLTPLFIGPDGIIVPLRSIFKSMTSTSSRYRKSMHTGLSDRSGPSRGPQDPKQKYGHNYFELEVSSEGNQAHMNSTGKGV